MSSGMEGLVAGVLGDHNPIGWRARGWVCECGHVSEMPPEHDSHVATEVVKALGAETRTYWGVLEDDGSVWSMPFRPQHGAVSRTVTTVRLESEWTEVQP